MNTSFWQLWSSWGRTNRRGRPGPQRKRRPEVQQLEDRILLSGTPQLLADINPGAGSSNPAQLVVIGPEAYFTANDGTHGNALWKTDGTTAGTVMLADINPSNLTNVNGELFFSVDNGVNDYQLWKSDGTTAGTTDVKDFNVGPYSSGPSDFTTINGTLFFEANAGLWKSDGTAAGTAQIASPGGGDITNVNGELFFFAADDRPDGDATALWKSDGTAAGTTMVADIGPRWRYGLLTSSGNLTNVNGEAFFSIYDRGTNPNTYQLWKSDGTAAGTTMVADLGSDLYNVGSFTNANGELFFVFDNGAVNEDQLWKSDGTADGTALVKDIGAPFFQSDLLTNVNGALYFRGNDGTHGAELWESDGTTAGTTMVKDINPGTTTTWYFTGDYGAYTKNRTVQGSYPSNITNVNGTLYFSANDGTHGYELWKSDGTAAGTTLVQDIHPGSSVYTYTEYFSYGRETLSATLPNNSNPSGFTNLNGTLLFTANDGVHGDEPWVLAPAASTLTLSPTSLPAATVGDSYGPVTITASGGSGSYTFALASGSKLPAGLTLSSAGVLSGKPTTTNGSPFSFTITATDNSNPGLTGSQAYALTVDPAITLSPTTLPVATVADAVNDQLTAKGGSGTGYTLALASGSSLPSGLTLSSAGAITGTPTPSGKYAFTIVATDSIGATGSRAYSLTVDPAVVVQPPATIPIATVGDKYPTNVQFSATAGSGTGYTFKATGLPSGMTITSAGLLSGTPTKAGSYKVTVTATDSHKGTGTVTVQLTVDPAIVLSPTTLPVATIGDGYSQKLTATGGSGSGYTFALASGSSLPPGLALSAGTISGNVTTAGTYSFTIVATDSIGASGSHAYKLTVDSAISISPAALPAATIGTKYSETLAASGGSGTGYSFNASGLPTWLTVSASGTLSGTPPANAPSQITFTLTVTDSKKGTDTVQYTLSIDA